MTTVDQQFEEIDQFFTGLQGLDVELLELRRSDEDRRKEVKVMVDRMRVMEADFVEANGLLATTSVEVRNIVAPHFHDIGFGDLRLFDSKHGPERPLFRSDKRVQWCFELRILGGGLFSNLVIALDCDKHTFEWTDYCESPEKDPKIEKSGRISTLKDFFQAMNSFRHMVEVIPAIRRRYHEAMARIVHDTGEWGDREVSDLEQFEGVADATVRKYMTSGEFAFLMECAARLYNE